MNNNAIKAFLFGISPVVALPGAFYGVYKKSQFSINLVVVFLGILSFLYIPNTSDDRTWYFQQYEFFKDAPLDLFLGYLEFRPDFLLQALVYLFGKIGIPLQFLLMGMTMVTVKILFWTFNLVAEKAGVKNISNRSFFLTFLLVLFSLSLPHLLSGIRFYLACSVVIAGFNYAWFFQKKVKAFLLLLIAATIHFSTLIFIPVLIMLMIFPDSNKFYRTIFIVSIAFMFIPQSAVNYLINTLTPFEAYNDKVELYVENQDFVQRGINEGSKNYIYVYLFSMAWSFAMYPYLLFTLKRRSFFRNPLYLLVGVVNIFYAFTNIYSRYMLFVKFIFVFMIIDELFRDKKKWIVYVTLLLFLLNFGIEIIISRYNITASFFNKETFSMIFTFFNRISPQDFLRN